MLVRLSLLLIVTVLWNLRLLLFVEDGSIPSEGKRAGAPRSIMNFSAEAIGVAEIVSV